MKTLKALFTLLGAAALSGCVAYTPDPFQAPYQSGAPYAPDYPANGYGYGYGYGATVVPYGAFGYSSYGYPYGYAHPGYARAYPRVYPRAYPYAYPRTLPHLQPPSPGRAPGWGNRDRDRDGVPNRLDRDRDGDGARNRHDRHPNDPRRR